MREPLGYPRVLPTVAVTAIVLCFLQVFCVFPGCPYSVGLPREKGSYGPGKLLSCHYIRCTLEALGSLETLGLSTERSALRKSVAFLGKNALAIFCVHHTSCGRHLTARGTQIRLGVYATTPLLHLLCKSLLQDVLEPFSFGELLVLGQTWIRIEENTL